MVRWQKFAAIASANLAASRFPYRPPVASQGTLQVTKKRSWPVTAPPLAVKTKGVTSCDYFTIIAGGEVLFFFSFTETVFENRTACANWLSCSNVHADTCELGQVSFAPVLLQGNRNNLVPKLHEPQSPSKTLKEQNLPIWHMVLLTSCTGCNLDQVGWRCSQEAPRISSSNCSTLFPSLSLASFFSFLFFSSPLFCFLLFSISRSITSRDAPRQLFTKRVECLHFGTHWYRCWVLD